MTEPLTFAELQTLHQLMQGMLRHARSADWDALNELDQRRLAIVRASVPAATADCMPEDTASVSYRQLTDSLRQLDSEIIDIAVAARRKLVHESTELRNQVKAKNNYARASVL